ncbi:DNA-binding transcriptional regulator, MarR family [Sporobacter termitidis DSM 10068]|uniref:DNA-binding transcriptional regulator, MarR family n=1 Tax=Sporobacter termitidis DSM 10068 TaxID=1123282 RepID=A0A1M5WZM4_9FIRM|nr:MarR family transcriptional regulator [Sporobacter termitidis]SHH93047.1 DNA-binding transcriptional regulator, MarR family [Sporobacter termitidis DSM 10068]
MKLEENQQIKGALVAKMDQFINKVSAESYDYEEEYLKEALKSEKYPDLPGMTLTECHVIDCIERNPLINAIGISQKMNITKGGISKITARLLKKGLIRIYRLEGNRKEIFYALTPLGKKVYLIHEQLHAKIYKKIDSVLDRYTETELKTIGDFIGRVSEIV